MNPFKKISIVTSNLNGAAFLEKTILSVISQNYPNLEYIIIDGGSTDGSVEIIKQYEKSISYWVSEQDSGLYEAIQKGFAKSTGEIMGWLNSDDVLISGSLFSLNEIFSLEEVDWFSGAVAHLSERGHIVNCSKQRSFTQLHFLTNDFQWIQQESTYWSRDLWIKSGGYIDTSLKYAGDLELWLRFFRFGRLVQGSIPIGAFRFRSDQLSNKFLDKYLCEAESEIEKAIVKSNISKSKISRIMLLKRIISYISRVKILRYSFLVRLLNFMLASRFSSSGFVCYDREKQVFKLITK